MDEVILLVFLLAAILLHKRVEKYCLRCVSSNLIYYFYLIVSFFMALPFFLMLKEGWIEKLGLEKSAGLVIIVGVAIFYFPFAVARFLNKLDIGE